MSQISMSIPPHEFFSTTCASHYSTKTKRKSAVLDVVSTNISNSQIVWTADDHKQEFLLSSGIDRKWHTFLHQFDIENYRICLALCSQPLLWKALEESPSLHFWRLRHSSQMAVWFFALVVLILVSLTYALKCLFCTDVVKQEYLDGVRVNYFFAPWISSMFLVLGFPPIADKLINPLLWCAFAAPVIVLELKIYGQWFSGAERMLSKVSNPSTYQSIVGNFVGAMLAARVGWKEPANFLFAVGFAHYTVLFVTLYQRLPTNIAVPKGHHPTFFLFLSAPSTACVAWEAISGTFSIGSKMLYFLSLFLFASMVVRLSFFSGSRFSVAWWAYAFPMTAVAIASIRYSDEVQSSVAKIMAIVFSVISVAVIGLLVTATVVHYFLYGHGVASLRPYINSASKKRKILQVTCLPLDVPVSKFFVQNSSNICSNSTDMLYLVPNPPANFQ
uniref:SLAC1-like protein 1 n=1 Tax=Picea abies TaxID=3329 RepID=A0A977J5E8_PICAB|nr:SLAC1-like protein 1 [Picea abies]